MKRLLLNEIEYMQGGFLSVSIVWEILRKNIKSPINMEELGKVRKNNYLLRQLENTLDLSMMLVEGRGNYNPKVVSANFAAIPQNEIYILFSKMHNQLKQFKPVRQ